jgi:hypothetical protein
MAPTARLHLVRGGRVSRPELRGGGDLVHLVSAKLDAGLLPRQLSRLATRAPGGDQPCSACGSTISQAETQYELEAHGGARRGGATYRLHVGCYAAWVVECRRQGWRGWRTRRSA